MVNLADDYAWKFIINSMPSFWSLITYKAGQVNETRPFPLQHSLDYSLLRPLLYFQHCGLRQLKIGMRGAEGWKVCGLASGGGQRGWVNEEYRYGMT